LVVFFVYFKDFPFFLQKLTMYICLIAWVVSMYIVNIWSLHVCVIGVYNAYSACLVDSACVL